MSKILLLLAVMLVSMNGYATDAKNEWHNTDLSDTTIAEIQKAKFQYKKCVSDEMQKPAYKLMDTRLATDTITKMCEPVLAKMREVYLAQKVPAIIADRHLKQMRMQITRNVLQNLMFAEAARKSGQPQQQ
ncbi:MAG: hypothetical protein PHH59_06610 [Methylovulum sp.]|uniref:hypothetical protein n=1 Tax=Methylovulum sp. TaxID=1916980 RepID=UPI002632FEC1|nr:hypothetical protein [Methylovulum sp.]MDD2723677.1 hypothetical protein [Methylovulum sp.]MDD5123349.1 hypothetical protein [Methylovulum sp.]